MFTGSSLFRHDQPSFRCQLYADNGIKSQFRATEINRPRNWKWVGPFG